MADRETIQFRVRRQLEYFPIDPSKHQLFMWRTELIEQVAFKDWGAGEFRQSRISVLDRIR
jgi:hypothetical protein